MAFICNNLNKGPPWLRSIGDENTLIVRHSDNCWGKHVYFALDAFKVIEGSQYRFDYPTFWSFMSKSSGAIEAKRYVHYSNFDFLQLFVEKVFGEGSSQCSPGKLVQSVNVVISVGQAIFTLFTLFRLHLR